MSKQRRITARKPARRRDVSGFGPGGSAKPSSQGADKSSESHVGGLGRTAEENESVELTIELHPSSQPDDFSSWLSDELRPRSSDKVVDVRLILPDESS